jgi:polysaccharide biosynthesis/export protein
MSNWTGLLTQIRTLLLTLAVTTSQAFAAQTSTPAVTPAVKAIPDDYRIGPGDVLRIVVARIPDYSAEVPVRPDGKITTPGVDDMVVDGKTPKQLANDIQVVLSEIIRNPEVSVIVVTAVSNFSQVKVFGEVKQQVAIPFREGLRVLDLYLQSGGLTEFAAPKNAKIIRNIGGKDTEIKVNLRDLLRGKKMQQNIELKPGDILIIPESSL